MVPSQQLEESKMLRRVGGWCCYDSLLLEGRDGSALPAFPGSCVFALCLLESGYLSTPGTLSISPHGQAVFCSLERHQVKLR